MEFWKSRQFKILYNSWNQKLKDSQFEDAEIDLKNDRQLKQRATNSYRQATELEREARLEYFLTIGNLANETRFPTALDEYVMLRHSEGASIKEIVAEIRDFSIRRDRKTIRYIIRRWQEIWGIRSWSPHQMNLKSLTK